MTMTSQLSDTVTSPAPDIDAGSGMASSALHSYANQ